MTVRIAAVALLFVCTIAYATPIIVNGDFSAGNAGFTSSYAFVAPGAGNLYPEGVYTVDSNPQNSHNLFSSFGDHTSGSGLMMIANGSISVGFVVWEQNVTGFTPGQQYILNFWAASAHPSSPALLDVHANGTQLPGALQLPAVTGQWNLYTTTFTADAPNVLLSIQDGNFEPSGNDFVLDDISLLDVPEPSSFALGAAALAALLHRRKNTRL
jgi:uncharacterized protein (TIGR03382 family)